MDEYGQCGVWIENDKAERVPIVGTCTLGRSTSNQVVLADDKVSRRHALIHAQGEGEYWLVDFGSSNGTYVNERRLTQPVRLRDRDRIRIGRWEFSFRQSQTGPGGAGQTTGGKTIVDVKSSSCWLLLADIESSTSLAQKLSTEELPITTGRWFSACKQIIEDTGGAINKYLGDGFLAYWPGETNSAEAIVRALHALKEIQARVNPPFRVVLHHGQVFMGGVASMGEESLLGNEVNFIFRIEKLAGSLGQPRLLSEPAQTKLQALLATTDVGRHRVAGFDGDFAFHNF